MVNVIGFDKRITKTVSCHGCAAILEYTKSEIQTKRVSCMGDIDHVKYIVCPSCNNRVNVGS
jgi:hypothetical protein